MLRLLCLFFLNSGVFCAYMDDFRDLISGCGQDGLVALYKELPYLVNADFGDLKQEIGALKGLKLSSRAIAKKKRVLTQIRDKYASDKKLCLLIDYEIFKLEFLKGDSVGMSSLLKGASFNKNYMTSVNVWNLWFVFQTNADAYEVLSDEERDECGAGLINKEHFAFRLKKDVLFSVRWELSDLLVSDSCFVGRFHTFVVSANDSKCCALEAKVLTSEFLLAQDGDDYKEDARKLLKSVDPSALSAEFAALHDRLSKKVY